MQMFVNKASEILEEVYEDDFEELFLYIDVNNSGGISRNEFLRLFGDSGRRRRFKLNYDKEMDVACHELFNEIDADGNQRIDFYEFRSIFLKLGISVSEKSLRQQFQSIDKDQDQDIDFLEFKTFVI